MGRPAECGRRLSARRFTEVRRREMMVSTRTIYRAVTPYLVPVVACVLLAPQKSAAQGTSAPTVPGVVRDASGGVLPGVTVEVASPALIEKVRSTTSDTEGQFRIIELRPGTYSVTF